MKQLLIILTIGIFSCTNELILPDSEKIIGDWNIESIEYNIGVEIIYNEFCLIMEDIKQNDIKYENEFEYSFSNIKFLNKKSVNTTTICNEIENNVNWDINPNNIIINNIKYRYILTDNTLELGIVKDNNIIYRILYKKI